MILIICLVLFIWALDGLITTTKLNVETITEELNDDTRK